MLKFYSASITLILVYFSSVTIAEDVVKFAAVIYRHGDRTPVGPYPTDPWRNESLWPVKFGELTNIGKRQHYALGQWLRKRYSHLLSKEFEKDEIYVRSTDVDRTLMSAQANLAGMYPPSGKTIWNDKLMWQPIPIHTVPEISDEVLAMRKNCPNYNKELDRYMESKEYKKRLSKYQRLMDYLTANTGKVIKDYVDIVDIYSTLYIETLYNFTLPNWTHMIYPNEIRDPACYSFKTATGTPLLARLRAGPLFKEITNNMIKSIAGSKHKVPRVTIYSGHDYTIGNVLQSLNMFDNNCPVYTATIFLELLHDNATNNHYIRISYRNSTEIVEPYVLNIPYCGTKCPVDQFMKLYSNLVTVDFDYECSNQFPITLLGISLMTGLAIFMTIYAVHRIHFYQIYRKKQNGIMRSLATILLIYRTTPSEITHLNWSHSKSCSVCSEETVFPFLVNSVKLFNRI